MAFSHALPPRWQPTEDYRYRLPPDVDHRTFGPSPINPHRYAVCIVGGGVFDFYQNRYLDLFRPKPGEEAKRRRYRLVPGPHAKPTIITYARLIALLVYGRPPNPDDEAHHRQEGPSADHWTNIIWQTPPQNRKIEAERKTEKRRTGEGNGRCKLDYGALAAFLSRYDAEQRAGIPSDLNRHSRFFGIHKRQIQRIIAGQSRADEVAEIRRIAAEHRHAALKRLRNPNNEEENSFSTEDATERT